MLTGCRSADGSVHMKHRRLEQSANLFTESWPDNGSFFWENSPTADDGVTIHIIHALVAVA